MSRVWCSPLRGRVEHFPFPLRSSSVYALCGMIWHGGVTMPSSASLGTVSRCLVSQLDCLVWQCILLHQPPFSSIPVECVKPDTLHLVSLLHCLFWQCIWRGGSRSQAQLHQHPSSSAKGERLWCLVVCRPACLTDHFVCVACPPSLQDSYGPGPIESLVDRPPDPLVR